MNIEKVLYAARGDLIRDTEAHVSMESFIEAIITVIDGYRNGKTSPELRRALKAYLFAHSP